MSLSAPSARCGAHLGGRWWPWRQHVPTLLLVAVATTGCAQGTTDPPPGSATEAADDATTDGDAAPGDGTAEGDDTPDGEASGAAEGAGAQVVHVRQPAEGDTSWLEVLDLGTGESRLLIDSGDGFNGHPSVSPDGTEVAFVSDRSGDFELYLVDIDGTGLTRLTETTGQDSRPDWSPDGTRLAFESERDGDFDVYVLELATGEVRRLTDDDAWDGGPVWSPDGTRLLFHSDRDNQEYFDLWTMDPDGGDQQLLLRDGYAPAWSPDGTRITYDFADSEDDKDVWLADADGANGGPLAARDDAWEEDSAWLPDGSAVLFTSDRTGTFHLHAVRTDGSQLTELTTGEDLTYSPSASAD